MDQDFAARAQARRQSWTGAKVSLEDSAQQDLHFWSQATPSARLDATWQMALEARALKGEVGPAPGLHGSVVGVRRRER